MHHLSQLQDSSGGLLEVLLELQSQVVNPDAGHLGHAALSRLCRASRGGAVQDKPHHDDGEGQDVESRELGEENRPWVVILHTCSFAAVFHLLCFEGHFHKIFFPESGLKSC